MYSGCFSGRQNPFQTIFLLLLSRLWGCGQGAERLVHHIHRRLAAVCLVRGSPVQRCVRPLEVVKAEAPSDGRRKTDTSGTDRRSAASAPASPRSRPSLGNRARSARSTAGGIAGSGSSPGGRAPPSPAAPTSSSTGPARQKIPLHDQLSDLGVKIADLALMIPTLTLGALREYLDQTLGRLALPCAHLVRVNLVLRGDLLKRPVPAKRFQRNLRLQLS